MMNWKKIDEKVAPDLQLHFFEEGCRHWASGGLCHVPSPQNSYVYAEEKEVAAVLGIDDNDLDEEQRQFGPLAHLEELTPHGLSIVFSRIIPPHLKDDFFISRTRTGEVILVCEESIKDYQPS